MTVTRLMPSLLQLLFLPLGPAALCLLLGL